MSDAIFNCNYTEGCRARFHALHAFTNIGGCINGTQCNTHAIYKYGGKGNSADLVRNSLVHLPKRWVSSEELICVVTKQSIAVI